MVIQRWDPYQEARQLEKAVDRMWRPFGGWLKEVEEWNIPIDVIKEKDDIVVKASLPGVKPEDIEVTIEDNVLTLKADTRQEAEHKHGGYLVRERSYGSFYRALRLPDSVNADKIGSTYEHGVLTVTLPKAEEKKRKQIKVSVHEGPKAIEALKEKK